MSPDVYYQIDVIRRSEDNLSLTAPAELNK